MSNGINFGAIVPTHDIKGIKRKRTKPTEKIPRTPKKTQCVPQLIAICLVYSPTSITNGGRPLYIFTKSLKSVLQVRISLLLYNAYHYAYEPNTYMDYSHYIAWYTE